MKYAVRQKFPDLGWQIVPIEDSQARMWASRGEPHIYRLISQAKAVAKRLNEERDAESGRVDSL